MSEVKPLRRLSNAILRERLPLLGGDVVNFGAGSGMDQEGHNYRKYCRGASSYTTTDVTEGADVQADLMCMPQILDGSFDNGLCVWVLEHVPQPDLAMTEMRRVLRSGARLILGLPLDYPFHTRHDYWRFGPDGVRRLADGWRQVRVWSVGKDRDVALPARLHFWGVPTNVGPIGWVVELERTE